MGTASVNQLHLSPPAPVNEVGGTVNGVDDPRGTVRQDAGGAGGHRLLADEAARTRETQANVVVTVTRRAAGPRGQGGRAGVRTCERRTSL